MCWWITTSSHAGGTAVDELQQLIAVQIVGDRHALGAARAQIVDGPLVGGVERKVGDEGYALLAARTPARRDCGPASRRRRAWPWRGRCPSRRASECAAWRGRSRRRQRARARPLRRYSRMSCEVGYHAADAALDHGVELVERAAQHAQVAADVRAGPYPRAADGSQSRLGARSTNAARRPGVAAAGFELRDHLVPQFAEHAQRRHRLAGDVGRERAQFIDRAAEPAELLVRALPA